MSNNVISGDYAKYFVTTEGFGKKKKLCLLKGGFFGNKTKYIDKSTVDSYEIVDRNSKNLVAGMGGDVLGSTFDEYIVSISFKDGTRALCELNEKYYKMLLSIMYWYFYTHYKHIFDTTFRYVQS